MGQTAPRSALLKKVDCFSSLDDASLALLERKMRTEPFVEGATICAEGDAADWMFIVASGEVRVEKSAEDGGVVQVAVLKTGDVGGMQSLFEKRPRTATLRAHTDTQLWVLDHATFQQLIETNPGMAMAMLAFMSGLMRQDSQNLAMTLQYVGNEGLRETYERCSPEERLVLDTIIGKVMAAESLDDVMNFLFDSIRQFSPCNRISVAFLQDDGKRLVSYWTRADYESLSLKNGYSADLQGSSLEGVLQSGQPRVINDLEQYAAAHPTSASTRLILQEGIRSSMTCPLVIEDRPIGFLFRSSRTPNVYDDHQVRLHLAIADRLSQAVEKAYRIEQLTAAMEAYFEMLGFVSHELKSPLGSMVMSADVLLGGYLGELQPKQKDQLNRIVKKAKYLQDLVGEYLNLSRLESGQLEPDFRPDVDFIGIVVESAIDTVMPQIETKEMRFTRDWNGGALAVRCAPDLLQIVMVNLLSNAVKYGNEGGEVRLSIRKEGERLNVSIWNEGPGFPEEERSKLFRKFSRIQTPELLQRKGTGVGLYTTWRIIQSHQGKIEAHSKHGEWAEFTFELPTTLDASITQ
ncbi:MAG: cyclic nucleotide-binding domain-containing protein, partial [Nitrospiraceae bacterium]|nr:cyclic nucleotide-binding domain-containing protein [Nitrospiraceae bacterium]